ncbi:hypothetical protein FHJ30_12965 [Arthrobacter sp. BB-1]|uniref:hypothetical protein n=1 Tax=unclassified Arthrobacter TaxID=235627 RepID=UPI0010F248BF|nr:MULTISPECIES: hypothetical protein [unclassified Arthrobacter]TNB71592.1 hypothetical protein FHJ30_12965 [Arthrobacter sp. BB-1]VII96897.1 hypothetical protein [Arthrobacter sp. DR-2P]
MLERVNNHAIDLPIVLVGDNSTFENAPLNKAAMRGHDLRVGAAVDKKTDLSASSDDLDLKASNRDVLARIARHNGITLDAARSRISAAQTAHRKFCGVRIEEIDRMEQVIGYTEVHRRKFKAVVYKEAKPDYPKERKPRGLTQELGDVARRAKWETFESLDTEAFLRAAEAMGMKVALVTFKVPNVENWIEFEAASTPTKFKGKDGALQRTLRTLGAKFRVPGFGKAFHGVWVLENTTMMIKRPHVHAVMMVPSDWGEDFIRATWLKKTGFPLGAPRDAVHIRWEDEGDGRSVIEQFTHSSRYLSRKKYDQEKVNQEWLARGFEVGHMWDARGFDLFPKERFDLKRKHVEPMRAVMSSVSTRPSTVLDETTGVVIVNPYARWVAGSLYGNREIMDDTSGVLDRVKRTIESVERQP